MRYEEKTADHRAGDQRGDGFLHGAGKAQSAGVHDEVPEGLQRERVLRADGQCGLDDGILDGRDLAVLRGTGKDIYKKAGEIQIDSFLNRIENKIEVDHHDMGFLYSPSCVAGYKLTGNETGRKAAILAADQLIRRFHPVGNFIQAWGAMDAPENYRLIIDCLLNLPLLYWASEETGDPKYRDIAEKHIHTAVANVIREDHSTWHTFFFDMKTGAPDHGATCQGYRDGSAWARGQAWGIYGMALAYKYTEREEYIQKFRDVTDFFLAHLPKDMVPFWDLEFTDGDDQPRDSSSASIAAMRNA